MLGVTRLRLEVAHGAWHGSESELGAQATADELTRAGTNELMP
jgi:hypothetical protein